MWGNVKVKLCCGKLMLDTGLADKLDRPSLDTWNLNAGTVTQPARFCGIIFSKLCRKRTKRS